VKTSKRMRWGRGRSICCMALLVFAAGCIVTRDVTDNSDLCGGYTKGDTYQVLSDVAVTEFGLLSALQTDVNLYRNSQSGKECLVASGTVLRVERVVYRQHPEDGASLHPMAVIQSGRWQGREVDLRHLSRLLREAGRNPYTFYILEPNAKYLRRVESGSTVVIDGVETNGP